MEVEPEEVEPEEKETPTGEPVTEPEKERQREIVKSQGETTKEEYACPHCKATVSPVKVETERGVRYRCPECNKFMTLTEKKPDEVTRESIYEEESDPNKILREILEKNPDVKQAHVEEVMDWAHYSGQLTPGDVVQILTSMKGMSTNLAQIIGRKYLLALSKQMGVKASPLVFGGIPQQQGGLNLPWPTPQAQQPLAYGLFQPPFQPPHQSSPRQEYSSNPNARSGLSKEEVVEIVKAQNKEREFEETKRELEALKKGGGAPNKESGWGTSEERLLNLIDERNKKKKEEEEKSALMRTLDGVRQALDNLHGRVSTIEQGGAPKKHGEEEDSWTKKVLNAAGNKLINLLEKGEATEEKLRAFAKELKPSAPPGTRSEYDMRVEQAQHEADARKVEAQEHRKGFEAIASGIRDGLASVGWNIGAGAAGGSPRFGPSPEAQTEARAPATEEQPMEWRDGIWYTRCVYTDCRAPMSFEDGKSTVTCPTCRRVIQVQPTEEELKRKVSAEKRTETEVGVKKEEPKREEPQREEPQREEEKPPEAEKPEGVEEKPSAEAKPGVPETSEGSDAKDTEEAQGTAG